LSNPEPPRDEHPRWSFPVEAGHVMQFAHAIGDINPIYWDAEYARATEIGHVIAPPTFTMASAHFDPDWPLRPRPGQPWRGSGRTPSGTAEQEGRDGGEPSGKEVRLHAEQHFEYHRHLRPGDVLTVTEHPGRTWEKDGRRGGRLHFTEAISVYRDQDGNPVITARRVGVRIGRPAESD
jgi:hydroxyacyl-ACP dehydratase HTD2-like protein with hotdog domain